MNLYLGLFELEEGSVVYVRKRRDDNLQDPNMDVVVAWITSSLSLRRVLVYYPRDQGFFQRGNAEI